EMIGCVLREILDGERESWYRLEPAAVRPALMHADACTDPERSGIVLVHARGCDLWQPIVAAESPPVVAVEARDTALSGRPDVIGSILQQRRDGAVEKAVSGGRALIDAAMDDTGHAAEASDPEAAVARHEQSRKVVARKRAAIPRLPGHEAHAVEAHEP